VRSSWRLRHGRTSRGLHHRGARHPEQPAELTDHPRPVGHNATLGSYARDPADPTDDAHGALGHRTTGNRPADRATPGHHFTSPDHRRDRAGTLPLSAIARRLDTVGPSGAQEVGS
jgi:hypothetical protein